MLSEFSALTILISFLFLSFSCQAEGDPEERLLVFHKQLTQAHAPPYSKGKRDVGIGFFLYVVLMIMPLGAVAILYNYELQSSSAS